MMRTFGCAVELGKKLHESMAKMTGKSKITTGKRGSILPSLEDRIEQAMRYATTSVQKREATPMTQNPEESPIHGEVTHLNPETLHKNPAFTQVITVTGPARTIYIGGQDAVDAQGNIVRKGDLAAQTHQVLLNLRTALAAASARPEHIIKWNVYLVQGQSLQAGFTAFQQFWGDQPDPPTIDFHLRLGAGTPGFSCGDGCHCRRSALAPGD
jgi:enamine deaminase RidA (YjgF/YER057c/UK114 family)